MSAQPQFNSKRWLRSSFPMGITEILRATSAQYPVLILGILIPATEVGVFRVALSSIVVVNFPYTLMSIIAPAIAATLYSKKDLRRLQLLASSSVLFISLATIAISLALYLFGQPLISFVFGQDYRGAWPSLMILCLASLIIASTGISPALLYASGNERVVTFAFALSVTVGLILSLLLVTLLGSIGAALSVTVAAVINAVIYYFACRGRVGVDPSVFRAPFIIFRHKVDCV